MSERSIKSLLTSAQHGKCHAIIHINSALAATVAGTTAQIPLSDTAIITPIQVSMIIELGKVFDLDITDSVARAGIASATAAMIGRTVSQVLIGWIPILGNAVNSATAASLTEFIGWEMVKEFASK